MISKKYRFDFISARGRTALRLLLLLAVVSGAPAMGAVNKPVPHQPIMVIHNQGLQLGTVLEGDPVRHTLRLANRGTAPLKIVHLRQWKGSRVIRADREIAPGAEGGIELEIQTLGAGPRPLRGVTLVTNEKGSHTHRIKIDLQVTPQIEAIPDRVDLFGVAGQPLHRDIRIHGNLDLPLKLVPVASDLPRAIAHDVQPLEKPGFFRLTIQCASKEPAMIRGRLRFKTNYPKKPDLIVPVMVRFLDAVQVVPQRIDFGTVVKKKYTPQSKSGGSKDTDADTTETAKRDNPRASVFVRLNQPGALTVLKAVVENRPEDFSTTITTVEPGRVYRIDVTARIRRLPAQTVETRLAMHTDAPDMSVIRVPLRIDLK